VATVEKPLFGKATLTGVYASRDDDATTQKTTIDFEHGLKSAPADAKDISELQKILTESAEQSDLQASQRDTQRRNDYSALSAAMVAYMTNNNGALPENGSLDPAKYINSDGKDPNGDTYALEVVDYAGDYSIYTSVGFGETTVYVVKHAGCEDGDLVEKESDRVFAIYGSLENEPYTYCLSTN